jgi:AraC family transcriptional regulator
VQALRHAGPPATIAHTQRQLYLQRSVCATARLGAVFGDPADPAGFRYYAAVAVASDAPPADGGLEVLLIPAGLYARHTLHGPYTRINAALTALHRRWLPASGYEPDDRPVLEHYLNSPRDAAPQALRTDLLIPIRPAGHGA